MAKSKVTYFEKVEPLVLQGLSNKEVAKKLKLTEGTVKTYTWQLFKKYKVNSRIELLKKRGVL